MEQESLERLLRDAQMNGIRQIPREPAAKPEATPSPPKEEGKEDYPYKYVSHVSPPPMILGIIPMWYSAFELFFGAGFGRASVI